MRTAPTVDEWKRQKKAEAAHQKRHWVRLTRLCNNRCLFCLDREQQDYSVRPVEEVIHDLESGRLSGAARAILSGGEPTVHPGFHEIVRAGRDLGYERTQVVTNGRMFAYDTFLHRALEAGLMETTFSIHGHTAELHDRLTGVQGSFAQSLKGLANALRSGRLIVNVDVVLNRLNVPRLREMLEFLIAVGVREFDLLQVVPFGSAWSNRDLLFYDVEEMLPHLHRALELGRRPDVFLWTNRLRAEYLEGFEDLIQDPHKLHDEVRGREEFFEPWIRGGPPPICRGDRCRFCFMERYCEELERVIRNGSNGVNGAGLNQDRLPVCLGSRGPDSSTAGDSFKLSGEADLGRFTDHFISERYKVRSLRCRSCELGKECRGAPIELARREGLSVLRPIQPRMVRYPAQQADHDARTAGRTRSARDGSGGCDGRQEKAGCHG